MGDLLNRFMVLPLALGALVSAPALLLFKIHGVAKTFEVKPNGFPSIAAKVVGFCLIGFWVIPPNSDSLATNVLHYVPDWALAATLVLMGLGTLMGPVLVFMCFCEFWQRWRFSLLELLLLSLTAGLCLPAAAQIPKYAGGILATWVIGLLVAALLLSSVCYHDRPVYRAFVIVTSPLLWPHFLIALVIAMLLAKKTPLDSAQPPAPPNARTP